VTSTAAREEILRTADRQFEPLGIEAFVAEAATLPSMVVMKCGDAVAEFPVAPRSGVCGATPDSVVAELRAVGRAALCMRGLTAIGFSPAAIELRIQRPGRLVSRQVSYGVRVGTRRSWIP